MPQYDLVKTHFHHMGVDGSYAAFYGERGPGTHDFFARRDRVEDMLRQHMRPGQRVLDIGCGTGPMVDFLCSNGLQYAGVDVAQGMLDSVTDQFKDAPFWKNIELKIGESEKLPYPDGSFDIVLGMGLLEYLDDFRPSVNEIHRVLAPGGIVILTVPNLHSLHRIAVRNTRLITKLYHGLKQALGSKLPSEVNIAHKEMAPRAFDRIMTSQGFSPLGMAFYDYKLVFHPVSRVLPSLAYAINRRVEARGPCFLANAFVGMYRKN